MGIHAVGAQLKVENCRVMFFETEITGVLILNSESQSARSLHIRRSPEKDVHHVSVFFSYWS